MDKQQSYQLDPNHLKPTEDFIVIQDYGFRPEEILEDHYVLGGLGDDKIPDEIINPNRDHTPFLPSFKDIQCQNNLETFNCTVYGTQNGIEILDKEKYNTEQDHSERATGIGAGTTGSGNSPHKVCEYIRNNGMSNGDKLPFGPAINTWNEYYSPKPLTQELIDDAKQWLDQYEFKHRWIFQGGSLKSKQQKLWDILQRCAPGVSVRAWQFRNGMYYKEVGESDNHWCTLVNGVWEEYWLILDHYDNILKKLEWDYDFSFAKQYYLKKKTMNTQEILKQNNGKLLMDSESSGDIGVVVDDKLLIAPKDKPERLAHILATYLLRNNHGTGVSHDVWESIPKQEI